MIATVLLLLLPSAEPAAASGTIAHAHNDYHHPRPLLDALDHGFSSVEADVFLVDGKLLVGHERKELRPDRTLQRLYLDPLRERVQAGGGRVHPGKGRFWLLIDIKTDGEKTYPVLRQTLAKYAEMLTRYTADGVKEGAVTVVVSGNRPIERIASEPERLVGIDGRLSDLGGERPSSLVPMISDNWRMAFRWRGEGPMPPAEREKLRGIVLKAHEKGQVVRFWATPESEALWAELLAAGVDLIHTDQLARLERFLREAKEKERAGLRAPPRIGEVVSKLHFLDAWHLIRGLEELDDVRLVVLVVHRPDCRILRDELPALDRLESKRRFDGVRMLAVSSGGSESIKEACARFLLAGASLPIVRDADGSAARTLGVDRSATAVVLDKERRLRYRGPLGEKGMDLTAAVDALLAGKNPPAPVDSALGASLEPAPPRPRPKPVDFAGAIAPLLARHCGECHRPGAEAPFPLLTLADAAANAAMIAEAVETERMPPWYAANPKGTFLKERGLSEGEKELLLAWVRGGHAGAASTRDAAKSEPTETDAAWTIGTPDLVLAAARPQDLPAEGVVPYQYVVLPHVFRHDVWIDSAEILPTNPRVVHHCNMGYVKVGDALANRRLGRDAIGGLLGKVPGVSAMRLRDGVAMRIPRGSMIGLQIHYTTTGKPETNRMRVGFRYARGVVRKEGRHLLIRQSDFAIPPGDPAHEVVGVGTLERDALGIGLFAHMHLRGKSAVFRAHYPDGQSEMLLLVPNYSFDWQQEYLWPSGSKRFPKGTRIEFAARYDNSSFNPYNPDPKAEVRDGPQTFEEMHVGLFFYTDADEELNFTVDPATGMARSDR